MSATNYALLARTELALSRVLEPINFLSSYKHHERALAAAASAYDAGQADSPLLVEERDLIIRGRLARERADPLRTDFVTLVQPLVSVAPDADLLALAEHFDQMSLDDWCRAGDRATVVASSFESGYLNADAEKRFGATLWKELHAAARHHMSIFCSKANGTAELECVSEWTRGYLDDGVFAAIFAFGERALGERGPKTYWQSYVFGVDDAAPESGH